MGTLVLAGRYEIVEKIGDGGMAVVYKARDKQLNRFVAIKILKKEFITDQVFVENFIKEAKAAASLLHPNIVTIHDAGRDRDIYYIVMEYVEGKPLSDIIATEAPLDYKRCIRIGKQIASALSLAHRNNIIHRDVKPHNILMTPDGAAKITDFGIAKAVSDGTIINDSGIIMGSVHYFSPEQSRGQYVDEKSDIYSLGIVLYEMITGRVPFDADNPVTIAVMHMNDTIIPPSKLVKGVPPGLDQIVMKATAKYQSDRFGDIDEMYKALDNINYITGIIEDPVIAGFVKPTNMVEEDPGHGYSSASPAEDRYDDSLDTEDDFLDLDDPDYDPAGKRSADDDYDPFDDDDDDFAGKKRGGLFAASAGAAALDDDDDYEDDDIDKKDKKGKSKLTKNQKIILIIAAIGVAIALSFPLSSLLIGLFAGEQAEVPDVVGLYVEDATDILDEAGFTFEIITQALPPVVRNTAPAATEDTTEMTMEEFADPEPISSDFEIDFREGQVMEQDPEGGSMAKVGSKVLLTVAGPPEELEEDPDALGEPTEVPDLLGKTKANAEYAIKTAGFQMGLVGYENSEEPIDTVVEQSPRAGEMAPGNSRINITISLGPKEEQITLPNFVGATLQDAISFGDNNKITINVTKEDFSPTVQRGAIISMSPTAGNTIKEGGTLNLVVSRGSNQITSVTVSPNNATVTQPGTLQFTATVAGVGDVITDVNWSFSGGNFISATGVLSTSGLAAGNYQVTATSAVSNVSHTVAVRIQAATVNVPNVNGMTQAQAQTAIQNAGLQFATGTAQNHATIPSGTVISYSPSGAQAPGTRITVIMSLGPAPPPPPTNYSVTVTGGTANPASAPAGTQITITATVPGGQTFAGWTVTSGNATLANAGDITTTFTMPGSNVVITASFTP